MVLSPTKNSSTKTQSQKGISTNRGLFRNLKLQKGSKPFSGWKVFLDIKNLSVSAKLEISIKGLGGVVSPFIDEDISLVVTDRPEWSGNAGCGADGSPVGTPRPSPSPVPYLFSPVASPAGHSRGSNASPATLDSPGESGSVGRRHPKSRAEAMLERVRLQPQLRTRDPLADAQSWGISICSLEKVSKLIQKVSQLDQKPVTGSYSTPKSVDNKFKFRCGRYFLKIEPVDRGFRPSYKDLPCWPTINFDSEPGTSPFRLSPTPSESAIVESNSVKEIHPVYSKQPSISTITRRSPRKRVTAKLPSPVKSTRKSVGSCIPQRGQSVTKPVLEKSNLVPPRPPSKRHPERSPFSHQGKNKITKAKVESQPGYCEICKVDFSDLRSHVQTESHKNFSTNEGNYSSLDQLIELTRIHVEAFRNSVLFEPQSRSSTPEAEAGGEVQVQVQVPSSVTDQPPDHANMRQAVDERQIATKMVGRKDTLEVQCNGLSNHGQTRFTCTKGDRENLGSIFLDERIAAAQLRKRRAISVSCKDLLDIGSSGERTHFLRSARAARSELSQLSPALSDNSHPLLNGNTQQPLLSPTLSERSHTLRTRSQIWLPSNLIEEESLLVTANNQLDKAKSEKLSEKVDKNEKSEKADNKGDKMEKSKSSEVCEEPSVRKDTDRELRETTDRSVKTSRNHCKNRSIRRKRLSAEEKLIEDNRGYYKVEVLNSKLRSTGYFVNHGSNLAEDVPNGPTTPVDRQGSQSDIKEPVVVRFKKVRRSELSVLSDEAENFMFGEQTRSEMDSDSCDYETDDAEETEDDDDHEGCNQNESEKDHNCNEEPGTESRRSRSHRKVQRSNGSIGDRQQRLKIKVGGSTSRSSLAVSGSNGGNLESSIHRKHRKRRTQAEAFITDNMDYYKFETPETRLRIHGSPNSPTDDPDDESPQTQSSSNQDGAINTESEKDVEKAVDGSPCPVDKLHFSFESVPSSEVWYQTFQRQDRGEELSFPAVGEPSSVLLPYQVARGGGGGGSEVGRSARRSTKSCARLPRKSPRCHASTLAILSSLVRRRSSGYNSAPAPAPSPATTQESQSSDPEVKSKKVTVCASTSEDSRAKDDSSHDVGDIEEIARSLDSILEIPCWNDTESKSPKGRGRKKQTQRPAAGGSEVAGSSGGPSDKDKDPSLKYLVDPAIFEELSCTCDVVSNPYGGPSMDIVTLLSTYSDCCCVSEDISADHGVDASCNSSECGTSSTCEMRMRKKRKRRNMTGWDKPRRRGILRRDVGEVALSDDTVDLKVVVQKNSEETLRVVQNIDERETGVQKIPNCYSAQVTPKKCGKKRKLRSSLDSSPRKGSPSYQSNGRISRTDRETDVPIKRGKFKKSRKLGWTKVR